MSFPILTWEDAVAREYQVPGTPFFYVIDRKGLIASKGFVGSLRELENLVEAGSE